MSDRAGWLFRDRCRCATRGSARGLYYEDFGQTQDEEVQQLLQHPARAAQIV